MNLFNITSSISSVNCIHFKEQVLAGMAVFIDVMTPLQIYVFALVATIYVPCAATIAVIGKELGWRNMVLISGFTIVLSIAVGGAANFLGLALL